jgi:hypothetical protein
MDCRVQASSNSFRKSMPKLEIKGKVVFKSKAPVIIESFTAYLQLERSTAPFFVQKLAFIGEELISLTPLPANFTVAFQSFKNVFP